MYRLFQHITMLILLYNVLHNNWVIIKESCNVWNCAIAMSHCQWDCQFGGNEEETFLLERE